MACARGFFQELAWRSARGYTVTILTNNQVVLHESEGVNAFFISGKPSNMPMDVTSDTPVCWHGQHARFLCSGDVFHRHHSVEASPSACREEAPSQDCEINHIDKSKPVGGNPSTDISECSAVVKNFLSKSPQVCTSNQTLKNTLLHTDRYRGTTPSDWVNLFRSVLKLANGCLVSSTL